MPNDEYVRKDAGLSELKSPLDPNSVSANHGQNMMDAECFHRRRRLPTLDDYDSKGKLRPNSFREKRRIRQHNEGRD